MVFCFTCEPLPCNAPGIISIQWNTQGSAKVIQDQCDNDSSSGSPTAAPSDPNTTIVDVNVPLVTSPTGGGSSSTSSFSGSEFIPGPVTGSLTITAYAFAQGSDRWLGTRCRGSAQASQTNILKYDSNSCSYILIPSKNHSAQITGDLINKPEIVSLVKSFCESTNMQTLSLNGPGIAQLVNTRIGSELKYKGLPMEISLPDLNAYRLFDRFTGYLSSFNLDVDFPNNPAIATYTYEFVVDSCSTSETDSPNKGDPSVPSNGLEENLSLPTQPTISALRYNLSIVMEDRPSVTGQSVTYIYRIKRKDSAKGEFYVENRTSTSNESVFKFPTNVQKGEYGVQFKIKYGDQETPYSEISRFIEIPGPSVPSNGVVPESPTLKLVTNKDRTVKVLIPTYIDPLGRLIRYSIRFEKKNSPESDFRLPLKNTTTVEYTFTAEKTGDWRVKYRVEIGEGENRITTEFSPTSKFVLVS